MSADLKTGNRHQYGSVPGRLSWRLDTLTVAAGAFAIAAAAYVAGLSIGTNLQLMIVAIAVIAALPHGGADIVVGKRLLKPRFGQLWLLVFALAYLLPGALMALAWWQWPAWALASFLIIAALHFGISDAEEGEYDRLWASPVLCTSPIILPALFHHAELSSLFTILAGPAGQSIADALRGPIAAAAALLVVILVVRQLGSPPFPWWTAGNWTAICIGFAFVPPLLAFAIYFGFLHAPKALTSRAKELGLSTDRLLWRSAPTSLAAAFAIGFATWLLYDTVGLQGAALNALFGGLAALTVPHMLLDALLACRRSTNVRG